MESIKSPADEFFALTQAQRRSVHFILCEYALENWIGYTKARDRIEYVESVVGTRQDVDLLLPLDALKAAKLGQTSPDIAARYREPITAMQDEDLEFPETIVFGYYAVYNLFRKYAQKEVVDDWLIVNQALSAENDKEARAGLLLSAVQIGKR